MMLPPKVRRSTMAAQRRGSVKVLVQPSGAEGFVGGDRHACRFLSLRQDLEQRFGAALVEFHIAQLISADHPPISRRVIVEVQDPVHLFKQPRVGGGLPGLGGQPADAGVVQDLPDALAADDRYPSRREVFGELG
jgi:hypothetical protein